MKKLQEMDMMKFHILFVVIDELADLMMTSGKDV